MKILVTGSSGFIGKNLVDFLRQDSNNEVIGFDKRPGENKCVNYLGDLTNLEDMLKATKDIDSVCHLGGVGDVYLAFEDPPLAVEANIYGTTNLMKSCLKNGVKKIIYASTWEVYGKPQYQPLDEDHPCNPDHPYSITKREGEQVALSYQEGLKVTSLRLGTAYGKYMRDNAVIPLFIQKGMKKEQITIQGDGLQYRQFTHVYEICNAFKKALQFEHSGEVFNIVGEEKTSIRDLAEGIKKKFPDTEMVYTSARKGDVHSAIVSSEKAEKVLRWKQDIPFEEGLNNLIDYYIKK